MTRAIGRPPPVNPGRGHAREPTRRREGVGEMAGSLAGNDCTRSAIRSHPQTSSARRNTFSLRTIWSRNANGRAQTVRRRLRAERVLDPLQATCGLAGCRGPPPDPPRAVLLVRCCVSARWEGTEHFAILCGRRSAAAYRALRRDGLEDLRAGGIWRTCGQLAEAPKVEPGHVAGRSGGDRAERIGGEARTSDRALLAAPDAQGTSR